MEEIVHFGKLMDAQKSASDVFIDYNFKAANLPVGNIRWEYGTKGKNEFPIQYSKLCPKTFRLVSKYGDKTW